MKEKHPCSLLLHYFVFFQMHNKRLQLKSSAIWGLSLLPFEGKFISFSKTTLLQRESFHTLWALHCSIPSMFLCQQLFWLNTNNDNSLTVDWFPSWLYQIQQCKLGLCFVGYSCNFNQPWPLGVDGLRLGPELQTDGTLPCHAILLLSSLNMYMVSKIVLFFFFYLLAVFSISTLVL